MGMNLLLRKWLEQFSRGKVFKRRLPARFHSLPMYVSPEAALSYWKAFRGHNWNDLFEFAQDYVQPAQVVWDVGANMGVFSICASIRTGASGKVLAIEPDSWSASLLRRSIALNREKLAQLKLLQVAVGNNISVEELEVPQRGRAGTHLKIAGGAGRSLIGSARETHLVPTLPLDWIAERFEPPDVLKVDVDGAERMALEGGANMLARSRPVLFIEVYERNADWVTQFLLKLNYELFDFDTPKSQRAPIQRAVYNTLALPRR
jgi:FkbM family methyltransferase